MIITIIKAPHLKYIQPNKAYYEALGGGGGAHYLDIGTNQTVKLIVL